MTTIAPAVNQWTPLAVYGRARSTIQGWPLNSEDLQKTHACWRAWSYLAIGMSDLADKSLLKGALATDLIDRVLPLQGIGVHAREKFRNQQIACGDHTYQHGIDNSAIIGWRWPRRCA